MIYQQQAIINMVYLKSNQNFSRFAREFTKTYIISEGGGTKIFACKFAKHWFVTLPPWKNIVPAPVRKYTLNFIASE